MDVLKKIIIKLQKRVQEGAATLLVKVKAHRGDPLNEETDIRSEMGHRKEQKEVGWNNPTNRTVYQFTSDWYLRKGESRDKMGEWLKKTTVRSQDQLRMLQANTHRFPSNYW